MGVIIAPKQVELIGIINKPLGRRHTILASRDLTSRNVRDNRNVRGVLASEIT
jgi:phage FluMu protein gp41